MEEEDISNDIVTIFEMINIKKNKEQCKTL